MPSVPWEHHQGCGGRPPSSLASLRASPMQTHAPAPQGEPGKGPAGCLWEPRNGAVTLSHGWEFSQAHLEGPQRGWRSSSRQRGNLSSCGSDRTGHSEAEQPGSLFQVSESLGHLGRREKGTAP